MSNLIDYLLGFFPDNVIKADYKELYICILASGETLTLLDVARLLDKPYKDVKRIASKAFPRKVQFNALEVATIYNLLQSRKRRGVE